jgi:YggT family protein
MNSTYLTVPLIFLINSLFSLYILAVMLRFLLQCVRADFRNPISVAIVAMTHPPLRFLRRFIPSMGTIDSSAVVLALSLQMLADVSILLLQDVKTSLFTLTVRSVSELIVLTLDIFIFAIFARALLSWFNPSHYHPAYALLSDLTDPVVNRCRKIIPDIKGLDFSPLAALLLLEVTKMFAQPLLDQFAYSLG